MHRGIYVTPIFCDCPSMQCEGCKITVTRRGFSDTGMGNSLPNGKALAQTRTAGAEVREVSTPCKCLQGGNVTLVCVKRY